MIRCMLSLYWRQVAHQAGAYPGFETTIYPRINFAGTYLYTWMERGTVRVECIAERHNAGPRPGSEPRPPRSEVERTNHEANTAAEIRKLVGNELPFWRRARNARVRLRIPLINFPSIRIWPVCVKSRLRAPTATEWRRKRDEHTKRKQRH